MPLYPYVCTKCGAETEELQKISDKPLKKCKTCGGKIERTMGLSSFALKGDGWYRDGYSKKESGSSVAQRTKEHLARGNGD